MIRRLYSGSLVHAIAHELMRGVEPESLLTEALSAVKLYYNLQATVERDLDSNVIVRMRTRAGPEGQKAHCDLVDELFSADEEEDDDDDGDQIYEKFCSTRTRHIVRAHTFDPRAKKYECVKWR